VKNKVAFILLLALLLSSCAPLADVPTPAELQPTFTLAPRIAGSATPAFTATPVNSGAPTAFPTIAFTASAPAACQLSPVVPALDTLAEYNVPDSSDTDHAYGSTSPKVTIISYCSYQRSACKNLVLALADLQQVYKEELRVVLRQYPQPELDDKSLLAAYAVEAAGMENRYWQMNNVLYSQQSDWLGLSPVEFQSWLVEQAGKLDINRTRWEANMADVNMRARVARVIDDAAGLQLAGTPVLFFNNIMVKTSIDPDSLKVLIDYFLLPEKAYTDCPVMEIDTAKNYTATFKTEKGEIVFELFDDIAPLSVNSFVKLARDGWYDGSSFFRVIPGFVAQGGDPSNSGLGSPGYGISSEVDPMLRFDTPGLLALNRNTDGLSGSQFFITYTELPELDGQFTIIGRVIEGMSVVNSLRPRNPETDEILLAADVLITVTISEN
jgi:cyclophilin family peptidyl-prolyl cis-trans isomerase/protein-disulfide isomerase